MAETMAYFNIEFFKDQKSSSPLSRAVSLPHSLNPSWTISARQFVGHWQVSFSSDDRRCHWAVRRVYIQDH